MINAKKRADKQNVLFYQLFFVILRKRYLYDSFRKNTTFFLVKHKGDKKTRIGNCLSKKLE
ncbi:hypothetical protein RV13_GL002517 [Enterococcus raffinosus]|nr:hypothetical protein RV13_GL002517 [Enterococcus raffinosus]